MTIDTPLIGLLSGDAAALLLEVAVKGSILVLLGFLATLCWRGSSAAVRHWVWVTVFGSLLALPVLVALAPGWHLPVPFPADKIAPHPAAEARPSLPPETSITGNAAEPAAIHSAAPSVDTGSLLLVGWALVGGVLLLMLTGAHLQRALEIQRARNLRSGRAMSLLQGLCRRVGVTRLPRLVETAADSMPTTSGVLRAAVSLPAGALHRWPEKRLEGVLLHELAHIRRRDLLVQLLAEVACAFHWYNPLAWRALRQLRLESEMACDDLVVSLGVPASSYGELLLRLARENRRRRLPTLGWVPVADRSQLPARLRALFNESRRHSHASRRAIAGIFAAAATLAGGVGTASGAEPTAAASERAEPVTIAPLGYVAEAGPLPLASGQVTSLQETESTPVLRLAGGAADTVPPVLLNRNAVEEAIRRSYPPELRQRGVSGTALVELQVDRSGTVGDIRVRNASDPAFALAAPEGLRIARFRPARTDQGPIAMFILWPVAYNAYDNGRELPAIEAALAEARLLRELELREALRRAEVREASEETALRTLLMEQQTELARLRGLYAGPEEVAAIEREREVALTALEMLEAQLQAAESAPRQPGRVEGTVVNAGGIPVPGAVVTVRGRDKGATTDGSGRFGIVALAPGSYTLEVSVPNSTERGSTHISVTSGETATANVTVASPGNR